MHKREQQKKAYVFALTAVFFWSTISSAFKITLRYVTFEELVLWSVISGILVLLLLNGFGKTPLSFKTLSSKDYLSSLFMGFLNPFLYYLVLSKAYDLLEAQLAGTLNYFWPVVLVLLSVPLLGQKIGVRGIVAIFISFFGIVVISTGGNPFSMNFSNIYGITLALGSAFLWAVYWIVNMKDKREETGKILLNMLFGLLFLVFYFLITGHLVNIPPLKGLIGTFYIGLFEMSLTFVIWLKALTCSSDTAKVSNLVYLSPFLGLVWINLLVGEKIHWFVPVGLLFVVFGIFVQQKR